MSKKTTAKSKTIEYETSQCVLCNDSVFIDDEKENIDNLPSGISVIIGGGKHMSIEKTSLVDRGKNYKIPQILIKWFWQEKSQEKVKQQYMCPACAESVYGFEG